MTHTYDVSIRIGSAVQLIPVLDAVDAADAQERVISQLEADGVVFVNILSIRRAS